jgi:NADP-reducing hydrogenase subunit HndB
MAQRISSPQDLDKIRRQAQGEIDLSGGGKDMRLTVHMGTCGIAAGARDVMTSLLAELGTEQAPKASLHQSGCAGLCDQEPMLTLTDAGGGLFRYGKLDAAKARRIVQEHVLHGRPVLEYLIKI